MKTLMLCTSRNFEDDLVNEVEGAWVLWHAWGEGGKVLLRRYDGKLRHWW